MAAAFSEIVDSVQQLDFDSKQELLSLIRRWLIEERREDIVRNARLAEAEISQGHAMTGSIDELMANLYTDE